MREEIERHERRKTQSKREIRELKIPN